FKILLPVGMLGAKAYSQDADVIPQRNIDEKMTQTRRRR
ncbi:hypothetical protein DBR06_SOUSAS5510029, partial [Sousa chinensis]